MKPLRAAVIGLGIGEQHIEGLLRTGKCELAWLCDLSDEKLAAARAKHRGARVTKKAEDIFEDKSVDLVSIASYDDAHAGQTVQALAAGKHVFVEKPLCRTLKELKAVKKAWARRKGRVKLAGNLVLRAAPAYQWLKEKLAAGDFGKIYAFDGDYLYGRLEKITEGWRKDVPDYSVMEGGGIHLIDLFLWLTGERPSRVAAAGNRLATQGTGFRHDDFTAATFQTGSGLVARVTANFGCVHKHQHVMRVFGTRKTFICDDAGPRVHASRAPLDAAEKLPLSPLPAAKGDLIPAFVDAVLEGKNLSSETQMLFDGVSLSAACDKAAKTHSWEKVEYI